MKVLFLKTLSGKAQEGDIKDISDGYARNFLIPKKIAKPVNEKEINLIERQKKAQNKKAEKEKIHNQESAKKIADVRLEIKAKMNNNGILFGSVSLDEISSRLKQKGYNIDKEQLSLYKPIKEFGEHTVAVDFGSGIKTHFKISITENSK